MLLVIILQRRIMEGMKEYERKDMFNGVLAIRRMWNVIRLSD